MDTPQESSKLTDSPQITEEMLDFVIEYARLSAKASLTEYEADKLASILEYSGRSESLNFWISEIDYFTYITHYSNEAVRNLEFRKADLREAITSKKFLKLPSHLKQLPKRIVHDQKPADETQNSLKAAQLPTNYFFKEYLAELYKIANCLYEFKKPQLIFLTRNIDSLYTMHEYYQILEDYYRLSLQPELTNEEADRLGKILEKSQLDSLLNFFIIEIDFYILKNTEFLNYQSYYENQKARIKEFLNSFETEETESLDQEFSLFISQHTACISLATEQFNNLPNDSTSDVHSVETADHYSSHPTEPYKSTATISEGTSKSIYSTSKQLAQKIIQFSGSKAFAICCAFTFGVIGSFAIKDLQFIICNRQDEQLNQPRPQSSVEEPSEPSSLSARKNWQGTPLLTSLEHEQLNLEKSQRSIEAQQLAAESRQRFAERQQLLAEEKQASAEIHQKFSEAQQWLSKAQSWRKRAEYWARQSEIEKAKAKQQLSEAQQSLVEAQRYRNLTNFAPSIGRVYSETQYR
ncbi:hypothetical protein IFO70_31705 [Phormidium tenue FACHB-886]|nr:hypothetical protein [Phormidium tenue FACHB-886]